MKLHALFSGVRKRWLVQLVILGLIISALNVGNVLVLDTLWHDAEFNNLVLFLLLGIGAYLLTIVESYLGEKLGQHYLKDIRHQLYTELMSPKNEQPPRRLGVSMSRMITDSNNIKNWASLGAATLVTSGFSFIGYFVLIFYAFSKLFSPSKQQCGSVFFSRYCSLTKFGKSIRWGKISAL